MACFLPYLFCVYLPLIILKLLTQTLNFLRHPGPIKPQPPNLPIQLTINLNLQLSLKHIKQMTNLPLEPHRLLNNSVHKSFNQNIRLFMSFNNNFIFL